MKVRMLLSISGTRTGRAWPDRGQVLEVGDAEGAHLCAQGYAVPVAETDQQKSEQAVVVPDEVRDIIACPEPGCVYEGTSQGLKIHTARKH